MAKRRQKVTGGMRVRAYDVLARAIEDGVAYGVRRAHKHVANPSEEQLREAIGQAVLSEISEWFAFDEEPR